MNNPKSFLLFSTVILSAVGIVVSKAARFNPTGTYGICTGTGSAQRCIPTVHGFTFDALQDVATVNGYTIYRFNSMRVSQCGASPTFKCQTNVTFPEQSINE